MVYKRVWTQDTYIDLHSILLLLALLARFRGYKLPYASGAAFLGNLPFVELHAKAFPTLLRRTESSPPCPHLPRQKLHCQLHSGYLLSKLSLLLLAKLQCHAKVIA